VIRTLSDDTLLVFLSDCHIGGDEGRSIFETPDELVRLFTDIERHDGPVELVLGGDFFDFLRIASVPAGRTRASVTMADPQYVGLFAALKRLTAGNRRHVIYLPGNHDAEVWWNQAIRRELIAGGYIHEMVLSYAAAFASRPQAVIYSEHGNEFDPQNRITDYSDPLDRPLGDHIVTDIIPRLPRGRTATALQISDVDRVFPLAILPEWVAGRLFYALVTQAVRWLLVPLAVAYVAFEMIAFVVGVGRKSINTLFIDVTYDVGLLLVAFSVFFLVARRMANRALHPSGRPPPLHQGEAIDAATAQIRAMLEKGEAPPLAERPTGEIAVFVSGHTHAPAVTPFLRPGGGTGALVNSGCWLRQLQALRTHFRLPTVFLSRFVQTHVRIRLVSGAVRAELWDYPRGAQQNLRVVERLAVLGRLPREPDANAPPRLVAALEV